MPRTIVRATVRGLYQPDDIRRAVDTAFAVQFNKLVNEVAEIKSALAAHTHGGVSTGTDTSAAPDAITYANAEADFLE